MTDNEKWEAVIKNVENYDGLFFYGVNSTHIFCRPSCKSKIPRRENIRFFDDAKQALQAGFRPCKRCRPDLPKYQPVKEIAEETKGLIDRYFMEKRELEQRFRELGVSQHRIVEIFKEEYGTTVNEYLNSLRLDHAMALLKNTADNMLDIAYATGFHSQSSFYRFFRKYTGITPAEFRKAENKEGVYELHL